MIDWLFGRAHAIDIVLAVMAIELAALTNWGGWPLGRALLRLLPGALILGALRGAMTGASWIAIAIPLALSFPAHIADLWNSRRAAG